MCFSKNHLEKLDKRLKETKSGESESAHGSRSPSVGVELAMEASGDEMDVLASADEASTDSEGSDSGPDRGVEAKSSDREHKKRKVRQNK